MDNPAYHIDVKMSLELLFQLLSHTDDQTWLVMEGDLSQLRASNMQGLVYQSANGHGKCVQIPLTRENVFWLKSAVLLHVGIRTRVLNVYLRREDQTLFSGCDCFRNGAVLSNWVPANVLQDLQRTGVIVMH